MADHKKVAEAFLEEGRSVQAMRLPPFVTRRLQSILRMNSQGQTRDAEKQLLENVKQWVGEYEREVAKGKSGSLPMTIAKWFIERAEAAGMDTLEADRLLPKGHSLTKWASMKRTAGEVRFIKDRGGDANEWGWGSPGPSEREIGEDFVFNARYLKPLAETMRSALMALGHVNSAYSKFVKIKSRNVSPDGSLGGKGYIQKVPDMRRQLMNCVEALSAFTDTVYDELNAPHWNPAEDTLDPRDRQEVREIVEDAEEIKDDPEAWAEEKESEMDSENDAPAGNSPSPSQQKTAASNVARLYLTRSLS